MRTYKTVSALSALAANGDVDKTVIAAQGADKYLRILHISLAVSVVANATLGKVAFEDGAGGTRLLEFSGGALGNWEFNYPIGQGPRLSANTLLNLTVDGAATTQASARAFVICTVEG